MTDWSRRDGAMPERGAQLFPSGALGAHGRNFGAPMLRGDARRDNLATQATLIDRRPQSEMHAGAATEPVAKPALPAQQHATRVWISAGTNPAESRRVPLL